MNASPPALIATWPTRLRNAEAVPQLNQPPCRWRIAAPFRAWVGLAPQPDMPPTVSASKLTPFGAATFSMMRLKGPRAAVPSSLPFIAVTADLSAVINNRILRADGIDHGPRLLDFCVLTDFGLH